MDLPRVSKFLCCIDMRIGVFVIAFLDFLFALLAFLGTSFDIVTLVFFIFVLFATFAGVYGANKKSPKHLWYYQIWRAIVVLYYAILLVLFLVDPKYSCKKASWWSGKCDSDWTLFGALWFSFVLFAMFYFLCCVSSLRKAGGSGFFTKLLG
ncbi:MAG: hypothetical protein MHM6MM_007615 [Cercozoa sp. M6MM]